MRFFDSHCHFNLPAFDTDRLEVWQRCQAAGVSWLMIPGVSESHCQSAKHWCETHPNCDFAAGLHPYQLSDKAAHSVDLDWVVEAARHERCVAIGECGLDKHIEAPEGHQVAVLEQHIELANDLQLPVIFHCVNMQHALQKVLKRIAPRFGGVLHAFSGSEEFAKGLIQKNILLGLGGIITYERAKKTRRTIRNLPLAHMLLETDAPDMPLANQQGQRNDPSKVVEVAKMLSHIKDLDLDTVAEQTWQNGQRLFHPNKGRDCER